jgi:hypothetical protein
LDRFMSAVKNLLRRDESIEIIGALPGSVKQGFLLKKQFRKSYLP